MPKQVDYPRASLKNCLKLSDAVNELGGECSVAMAGDRLGKKHTSGAFSTLIGAAVKYGIIVNRKGQLEVTQLYRDIKLAYDENEAKKGTQKALLSVPLFSDIFNRFENKALPLDHFEKLLIREFDVPDNLASRVASYFLEGAKQSGLLDEGGCLAKDDLYADEIIENGSNEVPGQQNDDEEQLERPQQELDRIGENEGKFSVRIKGPGMDSLIVINEEEDLYIVRAMLKKVEKRLTLEEDE